MPFLRFHRKLFINDGRPIGEELVVTVGAMFRQIWCFGLAASIVAVPYNIANGAARSSAVYCQKNADGLKIFADKRRRDGRLSVGLSVWYKNGQHIGIFGIAAPQDGHWVYSADMNASDPSDHCRAQIYLLPNDAVLVTGDSKAPCKLAGGYGTEIGTRKFSRSVLEGPVTFELDDSETFFDRAGKCS